MDLQIDGISATVSDHAVTRYRDRVYQGTRTSARQQLAAVAGSVGVWSDTAPSWITTMEADRADRWLLLGDDVVLPCCGGTLTTVLVRGGKTLVEERKANRERDRKRQQRAVRRWRQQRRGRLLAA